MNTSETDQEAGKLAAALRLAGLRVTAQRITVLQVLSETDGHPDVEALYRRAKAADPKISIATIYRTVAALVQAGLIQRHIFEGASARYERVDKHHHDHIVDLDTGEIVEFQSDQIEQLQSEIAAKMGYDVIHHRLELYCRRRQP
jgi:Fur family transcriptional regulator, ferric uptake regulator